MDILYLLVPLSVVLAMIIIGMLAWAMHRGQFDDLEHQGELIFDPDDAKTRANARRQAARADAATSTQDHLPRA